jgi:hypothetical protein
MKRDDESVVYTDTNRLMDKCSNCGANAGLQYKTTKKGDKVRGKCSDRCGETGPKWEEHYGLAIIAWNQQQRANKT